MHRAGLTLLAFLLLAPATAQGDLAFSFEGPGQAGPDVEVFDADWILLLFHDDSFQADISSAEDVYFQEYEVRRPGASYLEDKRFDGWGPVLPTRNGTLEAPFQAVSGHAPGTWGSLYIAGDGLHLVVHGQSATLETKSDGECVPLTLYESANQTLRDDGACPGGDHVVVAVRGSDRHPSIQVTGTQIHEVEWHGMNVTCPGRDDCPSGGVRDSDSVEAGLGNVAVYATRHGFTNLQSPAMSLHGNGTAALAFAGGEQLNVSVDGWVRLPAFFAACPDCVGDDRTFQATGLIHLDGLRTQGSDRIFATLSGDLALVRLDESQIDPAALLGIPLGVLGAAGAVAVLWKVVAWLATQEGLKHPRRRLILAAIKKDPGIHFRALQRSTDMGNAPLLHHIGRLKEAGLVVERRDHNLVCYFENHGRYGLEWRALTVLRDLAVERLHAHVGTVGATPRPELVQFACSEWGWSRRSTYRRIERLLEVGLFTEAEGGLRALQISDSSGTPHGGTPTAVHA